MSGGRASRTTKHIRTMKKLLTLLAFMILCSLSNVSAQTTDKMQLDSLSWRRLDETSYYLKTIKPRYKIYPTENTYISIKLDTATGRVWMVQIGLSDTDAMTVAIDDESLLYDWEEYRGGRFELYPTKNMYNFILIDTEKGYTYQVQWHTEVNKRFRVPIY